MLILYTNRLLVHKQKLLDELIDFGGQYFFEIVQNLKLISINRLLETLLNLKNLLFANLILYLIFLKFH
jgi:hypothetical protein